MSNFVINERRVGSEWRGKRGNWKAANRRLGGEKAADRVRIRGTETLSIFQRHKTLINYPLRRNQLGRSCYRPIVRN